MRVHLLILSFLVGAFSATAATWTVEKDGSGDYTVIQDAVNAAADGDTILIGPGRYDDMTNLGDAWDDSECVVDLNGHELTLIGSGDETIIGPTEIADGYHHPPYTMGFVTGDVSTPYHLESLRVEHLSHGVWMNGSTTMEGLTVEECWQGLWLMRYGGGGYVKNSHLTNCFDMALLINSGIQGYLVDSVTFEACEGGVNVDGGSISITTRNCSFIDSETLSIQYASGSTGTIQNCTMSGGRAGITVFSSDIIVEDCQIRHVSQHGLFVVNGSSVVGTRNIITSGQSEPAILLVNSNIQMNESHILQSSGQAVELLGTYDPQYQWTLDLRNNYWGTTEADTIAAWIHDGDDDPEIPETVQYIPFSDVPLATQKSSLGDLKAMFR